MLAAAALNCTCVQLIGVDVELVVNPGVNSIEFCNSVQNDLLSLSNEQWSEDR